jgi:hypothetical protein
MKFPDTGIGWPGQIQTNVGSARKLASFSRTISSGVEDCSSFFSNSADHKTPKNDSNVSFISRPIRSLNLLSRGNVISISGKSSALTSIPRASASLFASSGSSGERVIVVLSFPERTAMNDPHAHCRNVQGRSAKLASDGLGKRDDHDEIGIRRQRCHDRNNWASVAD